MNAKRPTKEEMRHDSFVETTARLSAYLQNNFMTVLVIVAGVLLAVVVSVFFVQSQRRTAVQADQAFFNVTGRYAQGAYSEVLIEADELLARHADREEGKWTLYFAGAAHLALSENDRAIERFDEYLARDAGGVYDKSARLGKGLALEARGDLVEALAIYETVSAETDIESPSGVQAVLAEARVLQKLDRIPEAIATLESLLDGAPPEMIQEIDKRLETLRALGQ